MLRIQGLARLKGGLYLLFGSERLWPEIHQLKLFKGRTVQGLTLEIEDPELGFRAWLGSLRKSGPSGQRRYMTLSPLLVFRLPERTRRVRAWVQVGILPPGPHILLLGTLEIRSWGQQFRSLPLDQAHSIISWVAHHDREPVWRHL